MYVKSCQIFNSMKKELYLSLSASLKHSGLLSWVDWQKGQFTHPEQSADLPLPSVLIGLSEISWQDTTLGQQEGTMTLFIDVYMSAYGGTEAESEAQSESLQTLDILEEVTRIVQGFQSEGVQRLSRSQEHRLELPKEPNLIAYRLAFTSRVCELIQPKNITKHPLLGLDVHGEVS